MSTSSERVDDTLNASETLANFHLDERVGALLEGCTVLPGRELETLEVLQMTFKPTESERLGNIEGLTWHQSHTEEHFDGRGGEHLSSNTDLDSKETTEASSSALSSFDNDEAFSCGGRWCKGGDWKRTDEASQDRLCGKKYVLNDGFPLCLMPKSGYKDPRRHRKDELDYPCSSRRLDLPFWAFCLPNELNDPNSVGKLSQSKPMAPRVVKGTMLPVIRIIACVVKDQGSLESEPRIKARGRDRYSLRSNRHYSSSKTDAKRPPSVEGVSSMKNVRVNDSHGCQKSIISINIPKDRVCTVDELQLHMGDWYYLDGAGHEQGPLLSSELQVLADQGIIQKHCSVFRKVDKVWVPVISVAQASPAAGKIQRKNNSCTSIDTTSGASLSESRGDALSLTVPSSSFDSLHPQFIGYTRGRLHELVMKSYKSWEFTAAINEALDPWINVRQPRKEIEKQHRYIPSVNNRFERSDQLLAGRRARYLVDGSEEDYDMGEYIPSVQVDECLFDDLCGDAKFCKEDNVGSQIGIGFWGLLDGIVLARVFHFLKADIKSLVYAALTCKHWRSVSKFYKQRS